MPPALPCPDRRLCPGGGVLCPLLPRLTQAYEVLSSPDARASYDVRLQQALKDQEDDYTGQVLSKWMPTAKPKMAKNQDPGETRALFVDEFSCIGCKQCIFHACATFRIEPEYGRSRVYAQWLDTEDNMQAAVDSCPVDCIHWCVQEGQEGEVVGGRCQPQPTCALLSHPPWSARKRPAGSHA